MHGKKTGGLKIILAPGSGEGNTELSEILKPLQGFHPFLNRRMGRKKLHEASGFP